MIGRVTAACAMLATALLLVFGSARVQSAPQAGLKPGDTITYGVAADVTMHVVPNGQSNQAPFTAISLVRGTEALQGMRRDADGTVHARLDLNLNLSSNGQTQAVQRSLLFRVAPNGAMTMEGNTAGELAPYIDVLNQTSTLFAGRVLHVGDVFHQKFNIPGIMPIAVTSTAKVVGSGRYRGYPSFSIQTVGSGTLNSTMQGLSMRGTFDIAGTTYYDQKDRLLLGQTARTTADMHVSGPQAGHLSVAASQTLELDSVTHAAPLPRVSAAPLRPSPPPAAASPTPSPAASPQPSPTPGGYYTPTPPAASTAPHRSTITP